MPTKHHIFFLNIHNDANFACYIYQLIRLFQPLQSYISLSFFQTPLYHHQCNVRAVAVNLIIIIISIIIIIIILYTYIYIYVCVCVCVDVLKHIGESYIILVLFVSQMENKRRLDEMDPSNMTFNQLSTKVHAYDTTIQDHYILAILGMLHSLLLNLYMMI